jgi:hypothetical protein
MFSRIILACLILSIAAAIHYSDRHWALRNMPRIMLLDTLPGGAPTRAIRNETEYGSALLPYPGKEISGFLGHDLEALPAASASAPLRLGYSYRELSLFGMPFLAYGDHGLVTYLETPIGYRAAPVTERRRELLQRITGRSYSGYPLPLHRHLWGWLLVLGFVLWTFVRRWEEARWRQKTGSI